MTAPLDNGVPSQRGASRDIAGAAGMWIMAGVAQQEACTTRLAGKEPRFVSGDQRGVLMHRRCVLVSLCPCVLQMDGTDTGFRPKVQCFLALGWRLGLAGYVVECDSMPRKESREKELGPCGRDDGSPVVGFRRSRGRSSGSACEVGAIGRGGGGQALSIQHRRARVQEWTSEVKGC